MERRSGKELRELFLSFFEEKGSKRYSSFSLIPEDPTLLFTIAGMVPFKPYFLGIKTPEVTRATSAQKCVRTNDVENVGRTARHHTFFEMLGNFSFGDYFKEEVIPWAWEFLTERVGLEPDRLYATIYLDDDEAHDIWRDKVGLPENKIVRLGEEDNFWAAGPVGPCGPCSEIIYDQGAEFSCGKPDCSVGCDCDRYLEIWNLVFMQYNRDEKGNLTPLPNKNIDTGMGLERLTSVVQRVPTDFETDLFFPIIEKVCGISGIKYGDSKDGDMAVKVISDHIRAAAFMVADGILPSNEGRGYVLRRLIRRSIRYARLIDIKDKFITDLLPIVRESIGDQYSELYDEASTIEQVLKTEEDRFGKTLDQGSELLETEIKKLTAESSDTLDGEVAFELYDTYGFPLELTEEICAEHSVKVDRDGFESSMEEQRARARASSKQTSARISKNTYTDLADKLGESRFRGYETLETGAKIVTLVADGKETESAPEGAQCDIVLDETPFYAERGGQVGDMGTISVGDAVFEVEDTLHPVEGLTVHRGHLRSGKLTKGESVNALVDESRRKAIQRHHTATHILHESLARVLGSHVRQAGSLVSPSFLRFDFNHFEPMTPEQIGEVERIAAEQILADLKVETLITNVDEAKKMGARALFDEKYGDEVRVLKIGDFSTELCGGTHVVSTGEIGLIKIIREEGIGSGIRRITAVAGLPALKIFQNYGDTISSLAEVLGGETDNVVHKVEEIISDRKNLERKNRELRVKAATADTHDVSEPLASVKGVDLIAERHNDMPLPLLREVGDRIKQQNKNAVILLVSVSEGKRANVIAMASDEAVSQGFNAGSFLKEVLAVMGGKGGGRASLAQGGTSDTSKIDEAIAKSKDIFESAMGGRSACAG